MRRYSILHRTCVHRDGNGGGRVPGARPYYDTAVLYLYDCEVYFTTKYATSWEEHGGWHPRCDTTCITSPPPPSTASERATVVCQTHHTSLCWFCPGPPDGACLTPFCAVKWRSDESHRAVPRLPNHRTCCTNQVQYKPRHVLFVPPSYPSHPHPSPLYHPPRRRKK